MESSQPIVHLESPASPEMEIFEMENDDVIESVEVMQHLEEVSVNHKLLQTRARTRRIAFPSNLDEANSRIADVKEKLLAIDHTKRHPDCQFYECVYDTTLVQSVVRDSKYTLNNDVNPIDFMAPLGSAYFHSETGGPNVRLCDHTKCRTDTLLTYVAVKVLNTDGVLGMESDPITNELPYTPSRRHHKDGDHVLETLKQFSRNPGDVLTDGFERQKFIGKYLKAVKKYPLTYPSYGILREIEDVAHERCIRKRAFGLTGNHVFTNEEIVDRLIEAAKEALKQDDYDLIWNPLVDGLIDNKEMSTKRLRHISDQPYLRYQPLDLCAVWAQQIHHFSVPPMAFWETKYHEYGLYSQIRELTIKNASIFQIRKTLSCNQRVSIGWNEAGARIKESNMECPIQVYQAYEKEDQNVDYSVNDIQQIHFNNPHGQKYNKHVCFYAKDYIHVLDSLVTLFCLNMKSTLNITSELERLRELDYYYKGEGFEPVRHVSLENVEYLETPRNYLSHGDDVLSPGRPTFSFQREGNNLVIFRKREIRGYEKFVCEFMYIPYIIEKLYNLGNTPAVADAIEISLMYEYVKPLFRFNVNVINESNEPSEGGRGKRDVQDMLDDESCGDRVEDCEVEYTKGLDGPKPVEDEEDYYIDSNKRIRYSYV